MSLPRTLEEITAEWLTAALGTVVSEVSVDDVIWGTASKVFLRAQYEERADDGPPEALCLKGGFDEAMRAVAGLGYRIEARFYRDIAPGLGDGVPRCWYAEDEGDQGLVLTDDLRAAGATFGGPHERLSTDQVAAALESLARWHGSTWNRTGAAAAPWLTVGSELFRPVAQSFLDPAHFATYMEREQTRSFDEPLRHRERLERALHCLWALDDADVLSLSHGDPHPANTYRLADGVPRFLDWQTACLAPWSDDVSYFLVGALDVEDRRAAEADLLRHYLAALEATGAPAPAFDDAWQAYRRHHLHGLMFALCPPEMQPADVCTAMGDRYATAATDHETLAAF